MESLKQIIPVILILILCCTCTERVNIDLEAGGDSKLVVFGEITNERKAHAIYLSKSMPYFYNEGTPMVTGATVTVSDGTETVSLKEELKNPGVYYTSGNYKGVPGKTYKLNITGLDVNDDGVSEAYSAETTMKQTIRVQNLIVYYDAGWNGWDVSVYADEPAETKDYYLFKVYKNGTLYSDTIRNYRIYDDKFFNGKDLVGVVVQTFDPGKGETIEVGDIVTLEAAGITEEYFKFIDALKEETDDKYPLFSGPAANLKGNITNGALGFFSAMPVSKSSVTYHGEH